MSRVHWHTAVTVLLLAACGHEPGTAADSPASGGGPERPRGSLAPGDPARPDSDAPPVIESHDSCVLSADCPAGQHCDLGECIQQCNAAVACAAGERCSARARCLDPEENDEDPAPVTRRLGTLSVSPPSATITDSDGALAITLRSDSPDPVRYRIQVDAPHLRIAEPRGSFVGERTLELPVQREALAPGDGPSTVRIFTTLGDAFVSAPSRVGLTSRYTGRMAYRGASMPLGTTTVALSLREDAGAIAVRIDGAKSLLFPPGEKPIVGRGAYQRSTGVEFTVQHDIPANFGGERNRLDRRIVRRLRFKLTPNAFGTLEGTFEERIEGLLRRTVTLEGTVALSRASMDDAAFEEPPLEAPAATFSDAPLGLGHAFPGWSRDACKSILNPPTDRGTPCTRTDGVLPGDCGASLHFYASVADRFYYRLEGPGSVQPPGTVAEQCARELAASPGTAPAEPSCALVPHLACALSDVAQSDAREALVSEVFGQLFSHVLNPALLAGQDEVVRGVTASFTSGPEAHVPALSRASKMLRGPAMWVMQPQILEYLARIVDSGAPPDRGGTAAHVEALRKLGRLFFVQSTIDGELARVRVLDTQAREAKLTQAQEGAVLTLLEAAAIAGVLERWGQSAPPDLGVELTDVLTPIDQGYRSQLDGDVVFGIREGLIPFVQERGNASSNFAQVLGSMEPRLTQFAADAEAFVQATRTFESNDHELRGELTRVQTELETAIAGICGNEFAIDAVSKDEDWAACGAGWMGEAGEHRLAIEQARSRLESSHARALGLAERIGIRERLVREIKEVRDGTIAFVDANGRALAETDRREGEINALQKFVEIASGASIVNFGLPFGHAAVAAALEHQRAQVQQDRRRLERLKEMRVRGDDALVEQKQGLAEIQAMYVDLAQLEVEMRQDVVGVLQAQMDAFNAVARAQRLHADRRKVVAHIERSPFWDPAFRILSDRSALQAIRSRFAAQQGLYLAGRALEYELNQPLSEVVSRAAFNVFNAEEAARMRNCLQSVAADAAIAKGQAQPYVTELSLRKVLGVSGERRDAVTGEVLTPGDQFRRILLQNENLDGSGGASLAFATSAFQGNGLWPVNVCDDKIASVSVQLVGDFLGDDDAQVELSLEDGGVLRRCDIDELVNWATSGNAVIQAGVNSFGAAAANRSLQGLSVASSRFRLSIPGKDIAPANADIDLRRLEDVVLRVEHEARPRGENRTPISLECLGKIGQVR